MSLARDLRSLDPNDLENMLERAAEQGARRALESIGLHDEDAGRDVREIRGLLDSWRVVRRSMLDQLGKLIMLSILGGLALLMWNKIKLLGGANGP